jgi:3-hydroxybutyryl-CoA dehydrogenase
LKSSQEAEKILTSHDVIFDFAFDDTPASFRMYAGRPIIAFLSICKLSLASVSKEVTGTYQCTAFGFNGLPTFFNREFLEVSLLKSDDAILLKNICTKLNTGYVLVDDRVGLVTPRVICMIINEAYFTVQEGTATKQDIDIAMKLGTNYPYGPFEWCERIGLKNVYRLLDAIYQDTRDERYRISALMKKEFLRIKN